MAVDLSQGTKYNYDSLSGRFVSVKHQRLAEIIHDYNPELELVYVPDRQDNQYSVVHFQNDGQRYAIFHLSEADLDNHAEVLTRLFAGDMAKTKELNLLDLIEIAERAEEIATAKREEDEMQELHEITKTMFKSGLHTFRHDGKKYDL